ncbi:MAG: hypothetical protein ACLUOI_33695 [Eisenbergiella sp.]
MDDDKRRGKGVSKPFKTTHDEQIKLVSSFDWLDIDALAGIDEELRELVKGSSLSIRPVQTTSAPLCGGAWNGWLR